MSSNNHYWDAVIFDFDGVIVDSEPIHYRAFQEVLRPLGLGFSYELYVKRYIGFDDRDGFREIFRDAGKTLDPLALPELISKKFNAFKAIVARGVTPFPGVQSVLRQLVQKQIPLAIASGSYREEIQLMLASLEIGHHFPIIVAADDVIRSKPDPETYLLTVEQLRKNHPHRNFRPARCLVIEDTPTGIEAARKAGLFVLAVAHSYPPDQLESADIMMPTLIDVNIDELISNKNTQ